MINTILSVTFEIYDHADDLGEMSMSTFEPLLQYDTSEFYVVSLIELFIIFECIYIGH